MGITSKPMRKSENDILATKYNEGICMRRQTQTRRHTTRLPAVVRVIKMPSKTAIKTTIGLQSVCSVNSFPISVVLEFSISWLSGRSTLSMLFICIKQKWKNSKFPANLKLSIYRLNTGAVLTISPGNILVQKDSYLGSVSGCIKMTRLILQPESRVCVWNI